MSNSAIIAEKFKKNNNKQIKSRVVIPVFIRKKWLDTKGVKIHAMISLPYRFGSSTGQECKYFRLILFNFS